MGLIQITRYDSFFPSIFVWNNFIAFCLRKIYYKLILQFMVTLRSRNDLLFRNIVEIRWSVIRSINMYAIKSLAIVIHRALCIFKKNPTSNENLGIIHKMERSVCIDSSILSNPFLFLFTVVWSNYSSGMKQINEEMNETVPIYSTNSRESSIFIPRRPINNNWSSFVSNFFRSFT